MSEPWRIFADTGGTFTDCLAISPTLECRRAKILSTGAVRHAILRWHSEREVELDASARDRSYLHFEAAFPGSVPIRIVAQDAARLTLEQPGPRSATMVTLATGEPAPIVGARILTGTHGSAALPHLALRVATTRGTNALLERTLTPTVLFITYGFGDLPLIRDQRRPDLFALAVRRPDPLCARVAEVRGRLAQDGSEIEPLDERYAIDQAVTARQEGCTAAAICLLHAWKNPQHELRLEKILRAVGFSHISVSHRLSPRIRLLARTHTSIINAVLSGPVGEFIAHTAAALPQGGTPGDIEIMTSAGSAMPAPLFEPKDSLLSGPAAGLLGAAAVASRAGVTQVITFDMGGTSTDVARMADSLPYTVSHQVGDAELLSPALAVESVAAGGGSVCDVVDGEPVVGPRSAGASPGPACYGMGGPLTLTDVNLLLGRINAARFEVPIREQAARAAFSAAFEKLPPQHEARADPQILLRTFLELANERMAQAIRRVSVRQGYDPAEHVMVAFGGAGGQHACAVADRLGIRKILVPYDSSLLSAVGLAVARRERIVEKQVLASLDAVDVPREFEAMTPPDPDARLRILRRTVRARYAGQDHAFDLEFESSPRLREQFEAQSRGIFGHVLPGRPVEIESIRLVYALGDDAGLVPSGEVGPGSGEAIDGPRLIVGRGASIVVDAGWQAQVNTHGDIMLQRVDASASAAPPASIRRELLACRLTAIAQDMGELLRRTAISVNVKERRDYSCALTDPDGSLVVSAPHLPVHLGALGRCVRDFIRALPLRPGDIGITNHPAFGGSHLPDVTLVAPSHDASGRLLGYAACRAHHAEIGGIVPGSLPPRATRLVEEGVVIPPMLLVAQGEGRWNQLRRIFETAPFPTRNLEENLADLQAQVAATMMGVRALRDAAHGTDVQDAMTMLLTRAQERLRRALCSLAPLSQTAKSRLDDGAEICVRVDITPGGEAEIDFTGSSPTHPRNFNAPLAVAHSAVLYVMRLLIGERDLAEVPLNDGLLRPLKLIVPPGMLNPDFAVDPSTCPAVGAGNVETSQQIVNCLLRALELCADGQGTMNNLLFGNSRFGYYETICGGAGAGPGFNGESAVHTHMTNTAITDPEVMEQRYPVRLTRFAIRLRTGGLGQFRGGDGVVREVMFLEPATMSIVSTHRDHGPAGLMGGGEGASGVNLLRRTSGMIEELGACDTAQVEIGDAIEIRTPGGGGYGILPANPVR